MVVFTPFVALTSFAAAGLAAVQEEVVADASGPTDPPRQTGFQTGTLKVALPRRFQARVAVKDEPVDDEVSASSLQDQSQSQSQSQEGGYREGYGFDLGGIQLMTQRPYPSQDESQ